MKDRLMSLFGEMSPEELSKELEWRKTQLCKGMTIEDMDLLITEIEVLEFLLQEIESCE